MVSHMSMNLSKAKGEWPQRVRIDQSPAPVRLLCRGSDDSPMRLTGRSINTSSQLTEALKDLALEKYEGKGCPEPVDMAENETRQKGDFDVCQTTFAM